MVARKKTKEGTMDGYCCCYPGYGKAVVVGLLLIITGLALKYGFSFAEVLLLVGGILVVKGLLKLALYR